MHPPDYDADGNPVRSRASYGGRPKGSGAYTESTYLRLTPADKQLLGALARAWDVPQAEAARRAVRLAASVVATGEHETVP